MTEASVSLLLPSFELRWPRRAAIYAGVALAAGAWVYESIHRGQFESRLSTFFVPLALTLVLVSFNHVGAQIVARGVWWLNLGGGTLIALAEHEPVPATIALGAGVALIAAGGAGLGAGGPTRGSFAPVAFRRPLLVSLVMSVAEVHTLAAGVALFWRPNNTSMAPELAACAALLAVAVVGLYRLRVWGVVLHLLATAFVARFAFVATQAVNLKGEVASTFWFGAVLLQLAVPLPMVWAVIRRRPVAPPSTSPTAPRLFAALVVVLMAVAAYGGLVTGRF